MTKDTIRQVITIIATLVTIVLNIFSGLITGKSVAAISDRFPVPVTPAGWAFSIWGIIYTGLIAFAIFQALPSQRTNPRLHRALVCQYPIRHLYGLDYSCYNCERYCGAL